MQSFKVNCVLVGTILLWASAFVGIRVALAGYSPGPLALLRFLVASFCMAIIYHSQGLKKNMPWKDRIQLLMAGMMGIGVYNICLNYGEISVSAGIASFVIGLMPVITVLLSLIFLREQLKGAVWIGILISLFGLLLLAMGEGSRADMRQGILLILVSALMGSILTIIQKKLLRIYTPVVITAWIMWGGTLLLLIFAPQLLQEIKIADYQSTASVVYMGIFPAAVAYLAWNYVLKNMAASKATITLYALPLVSTLLGFLLLQERPSLISLLGGGIALMGALVANRFQVPDTLNAAINQKVVAV
jgi:drug/metabolite transporter (DMT)-like permease